MTTPIMITLVILVLMFAGMLTEIIPLAATMSLATLAMVVTGIIAPADAYSNLSGGTIAFVAALSVIADAVFETGLVADIGKALFRGRIAENQRLMIFVASLFTGLASAFFLNSALMVLMIPIVASVVVKSGGNLQQRHILLGCACNATVGGAISLIGAAPNMTTQGILEVTEGAEPMSFFGPAPIALPLTIIVAVYFATIGYDLQKKCLDFEDVIDTEAIHKAETNPVPSWKKWITAGTLVGTILLLAFSVFPNNTCVAFAAVTLLFVTRCIKPSESLKSVDWNMIVILNFALAVASGVNKSGTGQWLADSIIRICGGESASPFMILVAVCLIGVLLTQIMSNTACCAMFTPICITLALSLGKDPLWLVIPMLCLVSCAVTTPIGSPCMTIALAGGYRAKDYLKVGAPLVVILTAAGILLSQLIYG